MLTGTASLQMKGVKAFNEMILCQKWFIFSVCSLSVVVKMLLLSQDGQAWAIIND